MVELKRIPTEQRNEATAHIDRMSTLEMVRLINQEDHKVADAVGREAQHIARAVDIITGHMKQGGRLIYVGAGTSGRLGILDAVECPPTYSTEPEGTCTKMSPDAGSKVAKGSAVKVWFSAGPQSTQVPDVKERSQEEARSILESAGFKVNAAVKTEDSADIAKDMVTKTDPAAGQSVPKGTTITIYVSSGMTTVPSNLVGQSKDSVLQQYEGKFSFTVEQESSDTVEAGLITRVSPDSGSSIAQGGFITIWVSTGKEKVAVPNITAGTDYVTAELMLKAVGLKAQANGPTGSTAVVVSINPGAGSQVDAGSTVTITTKAGSTGGGTGTGDGGNGTGNGGGTGE